MKPKAQRQAEAIARNTAYAKLTIKEKIALLGSYTAKKQRAQFAAQLEKENANGKG